MLSLENCTREVAYLSLLHWDDLAGLIFQPDMQGKSQQMLSVSLLEQEASG